MVSPKCPCPSPQNREICYLPWQRTMKGPHGIKVANQLALKGEYPGRASVITGSLKVGEAGRSIRGRDDHRRRSERCIVSLKMV